MPTERGGLMELELVREEGRLVIGVITKTVDEKYETVMQAKRDAPPRKESVETREFERLEEARRWIRANAAMETN